jgi:hypothetical protein
MAYMQTKGMWGRALAVVAVVVGLSACTSPDDTAVAESNVTEWDASIPHIVPQPVYEYLQKNGWGDYHLVFHMSRRFFVGGKGLRDWLEEQNEPYANLQEGDAMSGLEFLAMHRAMIEHLREKFGDVRVENDSAYETFSDVLDGWNTDEKVSAAIKKYVHGKGLKQFQAALGPANDLAKFESDDAFGLFVQTTLRITYDVDPNDSFERKYSQATETGAGIHNSLHGIFMDSSSPIDVGDPGTNLGNELFWGIHGWIEAKWQAYEKQHERSMWDQEAYAQQMEKFGLHMQLHDGTDGHDQSKALAAAVRGLQEEDPDYLNELFANQVKCDALDDTTLMEDCVASDSGAE